MPNSPWDHPFQRPPWDIVPAGLVRVLPFNPHTPQHQAGSTGHTYGGHAGGAVAPRSGQPKPRQEGYGFRNHPRV